MTKIKIEKNVPMPESRMGREAMYPFEDMQEGDSFFIPLSETRARDTKSLSTSIRSAANKKGVSVAVAAENKNDKEGVRCWHRGEVAKRQKKSSSPSNNTTAKKSSTTKKAS